MNNISILGFSNSNIEIIYDLLISQLRDEPIQVYMNINFEFEFLQPIKKRTIIVHPLGKLPPRGTKCIFGTSGPYNKYRIYNDFLINSNIDRSEYTSVIHESSYVSPSSTINSGCLIEANTTICSQTSIGFGVNIKMGSHIGHHNIIGDFTDINPGVVLSGMVKVGKGCLLGTGALIRNDITIGDNTIIGMGSVVTKDIPSGVVAYGNPCKVISSNHSYTI